MIREEAKSRLKDVRMPAYYWRYQQQDILNNVYKSYQHALKARRRGIDAADIIEPKIAYDLADRVAKMHNIEIADRLRALLSRTTKEKAALEIAEEIAAGEYGSGDLKTRLDNAVRVSLAVVTEGTWQIHLMTKPVDLSKSLGSTSAKSWASSSRFSMKM